MQDFDCVICGGHFFGWGNNPQPLRLDGRCCDSCNELVILARLEQVIAEFTPNEETEDAQD